tara:strand:- start:208 stop:528 length:321 start_codon:yes stop_codon:yes gene_type:complete
MRKFQVKGHTVTFGEILSVAPYSQEWEAHTQENAYELTTIDNLISEVAYCISKYTEDDLDNYKCLNEDYSWMPHCKAKFDYQKHQRQLKQELRELKAFHSYLKGFA